MSDSTIWNEYGSTVIDELDRPFGIAIDREKNIVFVSDHHNHRIFAHRLGQYNEQYDISFEDTGSELINQLKFPTDIVIDKGNNSVLISDRGNRRVVRLSLEGNTGKAEVILSDINCFGIALDRDGFLYVVNDLKNEVKRYRIGDENGVVVAGGNGAGNGLNQLNGPRFVCVDKTGAVYVSDFRNHRVVKWATGAIEGIVVTDINSDKSGFYQLSSPNQIVIDECGTLYVADSGNHRVLRFCERKKQAEVIVGGKGRGRAPNQLSLPTGLGFGNHGQLFVANYGDSCVKQFTMV